jgi:hypothetical protein
VEVEVQCPYCGEPTVIVVDEMGGRSVEDCTVCCRPLDVLADVADDGAMSVHVQRCDD